MKALNYIAEHSEVRDVLISGGDPLILELEQLEEILQHLSAIEHVEIVRIGPGFRLFFHNALLQN